MTFWCALHRGNFCKQCGFNVFKLFHKAQCPKKEWLFIPALSIDMSHVKSMQGSVAEGKNLGDPSGDARPVIPSLLLSCYSCVSFLCRLKIKVRIWVEWIHLWEIISVRLEILISLMWSYRNINTGHMSGTADGSGWPLIRLRWFIVRTGWKAQWWLKEAAHWTSALFVLLWTENMHVSSLSKHVCCDKVLCTLAHRSVYVSV